jgi:putative DNA primase/helicase
LADSSGALVGRMILLRLTQSFFGHEDLGLFDRLLPELGGILLWAVEGWRRLAERGHFLQPDSSLELLGDLAALSSPIAEFIHDCCLVGPGYQAATDDLYGAWRAWCERKGRREPGPVNIFARDLLAALPTLRRTQPREGEHRYRAYEGIGLVAGR